MPRCVLQTIAVVMGGAISLKFNYLWSGLSLKTQSLYAIVYITRYFDLLTGWVSVYNTFMKLFFILSSWYIIYLIVIKFRYVYGLTTASRTF